MKRRIRGSKRFHARVLAAGVAGIFAIALVAPASSAPPGLLKPVDRHLNCGPSGGAVVCGIATWTNSSSQSIQINNNIHFEGKNPADFSFQSIGAGDLPCTLFFEGSVDFLGPNGSATDSCSLRVTFSPNASGGRSAKLLVEDSVTDLATPVGVNGRGTGF